MSRTLRPNDRAGWTKYPHELARALEIAPLPASHRRVLQALVRWILGWHAEIRPASQAWLARRCGLDRRTVRRIVEDLEAWAVIRRHGKGRGRVAAFELLEPAGWAIAESGAARRRRRQRYGEQLALPLPGVAPIVEMTPHAVTWGRNLGAHMGAHLGASAPTLRGRPTSSSKRKKQERARDDAPVITSAFGLSRALPNEDRMPIRPSPIDTPEEARERQALLRLIAARYLAAWFRDRVVPRGDPRIETWAEKLTDADVDAVFEELRRREEGAKLRRANLAAGALK